MTNSAAVLQVAKDVADRINAHDTEGIIGVMSGDHVLVDSLGNKFTRPAIETGWATYFAMVPDYWIKIDRTIAEDDIVALFGTAGGTYVPKEGGLNTDNSWEAQRRGL